jgi:hypothetical protein
MLYRPSAWASSQSLYGGPADAPGAVAIPAATISHVMANALRSKGSPAVDPLSTGGAWARGQPIRGIPTGCISNSNLVSIDSIHGVDVLTFGGCPRQTTPDLINGGRTGRCTLTPHREARRVARPLGVTYEFLRPPNNRTRTDYRDFRRLPRLTSTPRGQGKVLPLFPHDVYRFAQARVRWLQSATSRCREHAGRADRRQLSPAGNRPQVWLERQSKYPSAKKNFQLKIGSARCI